MKLLLANHIQNAYDSLRANRTRTFLTVTGVAIGIASIVAILSLASGASQVISRQVDDIGGNIAVIRPGSSQAQSLKDVVNQQAHGAVTTSTLSEADIQRIKEVPSVAETAPLMLSTATLQGDSSRDSVVVGTTPELLEMSGITVRDGEFAAQGDGLVTIGAQLSIDLFGTESSLGKTISIRGKAYRVAGVLDRQTNPMNFNGVDFNEAALLSPQQLRVIQPTAQIQQINVEIDSVASLERSVIAMNKALIELRSGEHDFQVLAGEEIAMPTSQLFFAIAGVTAAIAGISLFVGGVGIMNIMLVNVAERTREIGVRKALGATHGDIVWQFLIESLIMAIVGGVVGCALGLVLAFCISLFLTFDPSVTWHTAAVSIGVAALVGVVFGLYPALRAAHKNPIESLNQHN